MRENDAGADTVRDYLRCLLSTLLVEQEGFSGKRPFGNSDWIGELEIALIDAGLIEGRVDDDGYIDSCDQEAAQRLLIQAAETL